MESTNLVDAAGYYGKAIRSANHLATDGVRGQDDPLQWPSSLVYFRSFRFGFKINEVKSVG